MIPASGDSVAAAFSRTEGPIRLIKETGNSSAVGCQGGEGVVIHDRPPECVRGYGFMFNAERNATGTRGFGASVLDGALLKDFAPIIEQAIPGRPPGETHGVAMLSWLAWRRAALGLPQTLMLYRTHGAAGKNLRQISKDTQPYNNALTEIGRAKTIAARYGKTVLCEDCFISNGTQDRTQGISGADFKALLNNLAADHDADWNGILGQSRPIRLWINQLSSNNAPSRARGSEISLAQTEFARSHPHGRMVGPRYIYTYEDITHFGAERGYIWEGEYMAKALAWELAGTPWKPLGQDLEVRRDGNRINITFDRGGLIFDTKTLPPLPHFGFALDDPSGAVKLTAVSILSRKQSDDTVQLLLSRDDWDHQIAWTYAFDGPGSTARKTSAGSGSGAWGNLRDSDSTPSRYFPGETLPNWCLILKEPIPA